MGGGSERCWRRKGKRGRKHGKKAQTYPWWGDAELEGGREGGKRAEGVHGAVNVGNAAAYSVIMQQVGEELR